jgi:CO/xanthine dehydrogenase Mo-binding subunit
VVAASDVGTVLNPIGVTGQLEGALVMGLGAATMEELPLLDGQVALAGLHEYKLPTVRDLPSLTSVLITDGEGPGPYGAKGVGELGHLTLSPALANAVNDAIGVHLSELPLTAERVYRALEAARVAPGCSPASGNVPPAEQDRPAPRA